MIQTPGQVISDYVIQFSKVAGSQVDLNASGSTLWNVAGIAGMDAELDEPVILYDDDDGERTDNADVFGALGIIGRPLPETSLDGPSEFAESACLRTSDGLIPMSSRDTRLKMQGVGPNEGTLTFVGYGGGFHSLDPVLTKDGDGNITQIDGTIHVLYCPYDYDASGVAQKAHSIIMDPTSGNEHVSIVHAEGQAILLQKESGNGIIQMQSPDHESVIKLEDGQITLQSDQIALNGSVYIGDPTQHIPTPIPLLPGPASPPCPRLFLSPIA